MALATNWTNRLLPSHSAAKSISTKAVTSVTAFAVFIRSAGFYPPPPKLWGDKPPNVRNCSADRSQL